MIVFRSLPDAMRAGYQIYDRTDSGYLVRTRTPEGWALALVDCRPGLCRFGGGSNV
jgi:hypothetical protein